MSCIPPGGIRPEISIGKLASALAWAAKGFRVFPLQTNSKNPLDLAWTVHAATDPHVIRSWFLDPVTGFERDLNIGCLTTGLIVADVDVKGGKLGRATAQALGLEGEDVLTLRVRTPSGGHHDYFAGLENRLVGNAPLGDGLDVRSHNGYVVAPGSTIDGKAYTVERDLPVLPFPEHLRDRLKSPRKSAEPSPSDVELDTPEAMELAANWLRYEAPPAVEGMNGDDLTYKVACRLHDFGISEVAALELFLSEYDERCAPPWGAEAARTKIENAYKYATGEIGSKSPEAAFGHVVRVETAANSLNADLQSAVSPLAILPATAQRASLHYVMAKDVEPDLTSISLIDNWLEQGATSVVYGASNVGKTFVTMSGFAYSIATGTAWHGNAVVQGAVVYVAAEAGVSAKKRIKALRLHYGRDDFPLALVPCPVDLLRPAGDCEAIVAMVADVERETGQKVVLIVIDTLSRALAGGNENGPEDMGAFIMNVDRIRAQTEAHIMLVHHCGKNEALGARGWSGLRAATDTEIEITSGVIRGTKQRDIEAQLPVGFKLKSVLIGRKATGLPVTSAIAEFGEVEAEVTDASLTPDLQQSIQHRIAAREWRADSQCENWAGLAIAQALGFEEPDKAERKHAKEMLNICVANSVLRVVKRPDTKRKLRAFIEVGSHFAPPIQGGAE